MGGGGIKIGRCLREGLWFSLIFSIFSLSILFFSFCSVNIICAVFVQDGALTNGDDEDWRVFYAPYGEGCMYALV